MKCRAYLIKYEKQNYRLNTYTKLFLICLSFQRLSVANFKIQSKIAFLICKKGSDRTFWLSELRWMVLKALWNWFRLIHIVLSARCDLWLYTNCDMANLFWWYQATKVLYALVGIRNWFSMLKGSFWCQNLIFTQRQIVPFCTKPSKWR